VVHVHEAVLARQAERRLRLQHQVRSGLIRNENRKVLSKLRGVTP
jgi:hypothetical protein